MKHPIMGPDPMDHDRNFTGHLNSFRGTHPSGGIHSAAAAQKMGSLVYGDDLHTRTASTTTASGENVMNTRDIADSDGEGNYTKSPTGEGESGIRTT